MAKMLHMVVVYRAVLWKPILQSITKNINFESSLSICAPKATLYADIAAFNLLQVVDCLKN